MVAEFPKSTLMAAINYKSLFCESSDAIYAYCGMDNCVELYIFRFILFLELRSTVWGGPPI